MHIHANQFNLNVDLYAANAAAMAGAKEAAEETRRKLISFASAMAGEVDDPADRVMKLNGDGERRDRSSENEEQDEDGGNAQAEQGDAEGNPFSGWA